MFKSNGGNKEDDVDNSFDEEDGDNDDNGFSPRWKWFSLIEKMAQGDITKFEEVYKQNFISALNLLSFWKERDEYLREVEKTRNRNKNKNR